VLIFVTPETYVTIFFNWCQPELNLSISNVLFWLWSIKGLSAYSKLMESSQFWCDVRFSSYETYVTLYETYVTMTK
jgi:hypothetical protein